MARILILSFVEWAGAFQRPQHMAIGLARRGHDVAYATPVYLHRRRKAFASGVALPQNLKILGSAQLPGASRFALLAAFNEKWMLRNILSHSSDAYDAVIFNDPRWAEVVVEVPAKARVFDCMDDLSAASPSPEWAHQKEQLALKTANRIWTGTASLADRLHGQHEHVRFIPGGVDFDHFANPDRTDVDKIRAELPAGDGPLAGYFGVLNERFDMRLVEAILENSNWRVLLIGPTTSRAPKISNNERIKYIGPKPYALLPAYLAHFDAGLIPYDNTGPHRFLYPVKALEYLAGGKPVLATPLPDLVRFLSGYVLFGADCAAWRAAAQFIASANPEVQRKTVAGRQYARSRSWDSMIDEIVQELGELGVPHNH